MSNNIVFVKGSLFEQTDLLLIESSVLLGYLMNFHNISPNYYDYLKDTGKTYFLKRKETKKITFKRAVTEEEKQKKNEKRKRREKEIISLSGLLKLSKIFDFDDDLIRGYLLEFRNLDEKTKEICKKQGIMYFEKYKKTKQLEKLERDRKRREKEEKEELRNQEFINQINREL